MNIPPRPALLMAVQREMERDTPHLGKVAELVSRDTAMAANLLRAANAVHFTSRQPVTTIAQAVALMGTDQCTAILTGLITRQVLGVGKMMMARFWDVSEKRARGMGFLARELRAAPVGLAYSFGLFCDIGIPLMKARHDTYLETLSLANQLACEQFLEIEMSRHEIHHAETGALLTENWGIAPEVTAAIRLHHTPEALQDASIPVMVKNLVACNFLVENAIQAHRGAAFAPLQSKGGAPACEMLGIAPADVDALCQEIIAQFTRAR